MKKVIVTTSWDDGHILDKKLASLLVKYGLKGTFYISPRNQQFSKKDLLTDYDIVNLNKSFEIGAHTMTHPILTKIDGDKAKEEIISSKKYLDKLLGKKVVSFCYPSGKHNLYIQNLVKEAGFIYARTVERHRFSRPSNLYISPTSIHTYKQYQDVFKIAKFSGWNPRKFLKNMNWEYLARSTFDELKSGGIYHLWGHSWIIDKRGEWDKLERLFSYIGNRQNVLYLENKDLINV